MTAADVLEGWAAVPVITEFLMTQSEAADCDGEQEVCVRGGVPCHPCRDAWAVEDAAYALHSVWMKFDPLMPKADKG